MILKIVNLIVNEKHSTLKTAQQFDIPLKTLEKWITAYNKDSTVFNSNYLSQSQIIDSLKKQVSQLKRDNEVLKKNNFFTGKKGIALFESIKILNNSNYKCSVSKVSRAMVILGIKSIVTKSFPKRKSTLTNEEKKLIVNLIKDLGINHLNQVWTTDITYIPTINEGTFYLISYIDYYSKKVVSWGLFENQKTDKLIIVLKKAIKNRNPNPGLIIHSDKGSQMRSKLYREFLNNNHFVYSYTSLVHSCDENATQESFHSL